MGNDCKVCKKNNAEQELIISPIIKDPEDSLDHVKSEQRFSTFKEIINNNPEQYKKLLKLKNSFLAFQKRKIYKRLLNKFREDQKAFTYEELFETLSKENQYKSLQKRTNETYRYKSGAVYIGDWLGGFRHGNGDMTWEDGVT